ncbi:MAG: DUF3857 domain-containing protein [Candidatus Omnitrophica bacterium]|nr:DUF3857 domain-containing protein [Candidatus Omnitrophota bacterium]
MSSKSLLKISAALFIVFALSCSRAQDEEAKNKPSASQQALKSSYDALALDYQKRLKADPGNQEIRFEAGDFFYQFRDYKTAIEILKESKSSKNRELLAKAYTKDKDYDLAIEVYEQLGEDLKDSESLFLYATVLEAKNLFPMALRAYKKVKPPYEDMAKERIDFIKTKIETGTPQEIAKLSVQASDFVSSLEDDAAVILLVDEKTSILPDNTSVSTIHIIEKVLKERGKELAEVEIGYDSTYQRVELDYARSITKDEKVLYTGKENIRDVSRYLNYPLYSNSRAFIVSMPAVDVGSIIEYKINIYASKLINKDDFSFIYRLREKYPIYMAKFELTTPKKTPVNIKYFNQEYAQGINLKPEIKEETDTKTHTWRFNEIQAIIPEYKMPSGSLVNPAFAVSSLTSWDEVYNWWRPLYEDKLDLSDEIKDFVKELTKGAKDDFEKAKNIFEYVSQDIRYVAIEYGDSGYEPHHAQEVFTNRYGDCKDQAILLVGMLREAGLKAYPVLIPTRKAYAIDEDFATISFNHAIAVLDMEDELVFMDPTSETSAFQTVPLGDQERKVMVFLDKTYRITEIAQDRDNFLKYTMNIDISQEEDAVITREVQSHGYFASGYRYYLKYTHPAIIKEDIQQKMLEISSLSKLIRHEIINVDDFDQDPKLIYTFKAEKFLNPARNLRIVPVLDQLKPDHNVIGKTKRNFPIDFDGLSTESARIKINLPANMKIKSLPESKTFENKWFKLVVSYQESDKTIDFFEELTTKRRFVYQDEYQEYMEHLKEAIYFLREEIILEKI